MTRAPLSPSSPWSMWRCLAAITLLVWSVSNARAVTTADQPSAIVVFPYLMADSSRGVDTNVRLANTSSSQAYVRCFYEDHTRHCDSDGSVCDADHPCGAGAGCAPGFVVSEFLLQVGRQQSLEWQLSTGLAQVPGEGSGTVPGFAEQSFIGVLRCVEVDITGVPLGANHLIGSATVQTARMDGEERTYDWARYNAVGLEGTDLAGETPTELKLGGPEGQYAGCNNVQVLTHSYDGVQSPANPSRTMETKVVIVPCAGDLQGAVPAEVTVGYSSINEFDQRIATGSFAVSGQRIQTLRQIDTVLTAAGAGTVTGQTRFTRSDGSAFIMLAIESQRPASDALPSSAALNVPGHGDLEQSDVLIIPPVGTPATPTVTPMPPTPTPSVTPPTTASTTPTAILTATPTASLTPVMQTCPGDCDGNAAVDVSELVRGVNILLGSVRVSRCPAFDASRDGRVSVDELVKGVNSALKGCD